MIRRTTIEIDQELLQRAKDALGQPTTRATVDEALRRAAAGAQDARALLAERQLDYLRTLGNHLDVDVLASDDMWR